MRYLLLVLVLLFCQCWQTRYMDSLSSIRQLEDRGCKVKYKKISLGYIVLDIDAQNRKLTAKSYVRGYLIGWSEVKKKWYYADGLIFDDSRACKKCGEFPTEEGYDACIGYVPGMESVCCGHGVSNSIMEGE